MATLRRKVVGREASAARKVASVRLAAIALGVVERGGAREAIRNAIVDERGAAQLCAGAHLCYYPDVWTDRLPRQRILERVVALRPQHATPAAPC